MRKRLIAGALTLAFVGSSAVTVLTHAAPSCNRCKKEGCPAGHCYIDCVSCCYKALGGAIVCYK